VLDHDHGAVRLISLSRLGGLLGLGIGHARDRLVHNRSLGSGEQHADLEPLFLAVRQRAGDPVADRTNRMISGCC